MNGAMKHGGRGRECNESVQLWNSKQNTTQHTVKCWNGESQIITDLDLWRKNSQLFGLSGLKNPESVDMVCEFVSFMICFLLLALQNQSFLSSSVCSSVFVLFLILFWQHWKFSLASATDKMVTLVFFVIFNMKPWAYKQ